MAAGIGQAPVFAFYAQAYQILRGVSGTGPGNGPMIMLGEGFIGPDLYANFLPTADRMGLDFHVRQVARRYLADPLRSTWHSTRTSPPAASLPMSLARAVSRRPSTPVRASFPPASSLSVRRPSRGCH